MDKKIKILCTLGPSSLNEKAIVMMDELGVDLFRINLSHTDLDELEGIIMYIRQYTSKPICLDTEGAQVRTGLMENGKTFMENNSTVKLVTEQLTGNAHIIPLKPESVFPQIRPGDLISLDFESVLLQVMVSDRSSVTAKVVSGGFVGSNKAVTIDRLLDLPVMTDKDISALSVGRKQGLTNFALSFAGSREDVKAFRKLAGEGAHIISKIESRRGIDHLGAILDVSDAILIDRGDLSREVPAEKIPFLQKYIIRSANSKKVPVYVATNLLESMVKVKIPTRAEASDVINTLIDGADGLVLAAETAIGAYPVNCVVMVSKMINQYTSFLHGQHETGEKESFLLSQPHGGTLVSRMQDHYDLREIKGLKILRVDATVLLNAEQIGIGTFSPLEGFMNKEELESVLKDYRLPNGIVWPIPILLQVGRDAVSGIKTGDLVCLVLEETSEPYAVLHVEEIYPYDLYQMSRETYGTADDGHPGARMLMSGGEYFVGGKIEVIRRLPSEYKNYEMTPKQVRLIFENKGWSRVVAFHTRNVIHRVHEHIQMAAMEKHYCDGIFIHPVIGPKKKGDYNPGIILKSYELMLKKHYPSDKVLLSSFQNYSRYAGPREAVFTALCRKNFGCSHFIVGRDHTGVGQYYGPDDAHRLFRELGDIGITPVFFNNVNYCRKCGQYVETCKHGDLDLLSISGTEGRAMIESGILPPEWFMRKDISQLILNAIGRGEEIFI
ncbi:MAG: sulfate adenylyltransferase [Deltaproteobacteria bacterium]|nr:sulfate adenylyltransferase [Deltaproteobacteria bacterium]